MNKSNNLLCCIVVYIYIYIVYIYIHCIYIIYIYCGVIYWLTHIVHLYHEFICSNVGSFQSVWCVVAPCVLRNVS